MRQIQGNDMTKVEYSHIQMLLNSLEYKFTRVGDTTVTGCWAFLPNGFQVAYGESACVDPANFDFELGKKYAQERCQQAATNKLWELEGYLLKVTGATSNYFHLQQCMITPTTEVMDFGRAVFAMKQGKKVARSGWNGAGMFAYYVSAGKYPAQMDLIKGEFKDNLVPYREYLALKTAQGDIATWSPSTSDALACDWLIID